MDNKLPLKALVPIQELPQETAWIHTQLYNEPIYMTSVVILTVGLVKPETHTIKTEVVTSLAI